MRIAVACLLLIPVLVHGQDNPARAVVQAAIEAHGGAEALAKARTARSRSTGTMTVQGKEFKYSATAAYALPDKCRLDFSAEAPGMKIEAVQVMNGRKQKVQSKFNGTEQPTDARMKTELQQAVLLQDITTLTPLLEPKKYTLKLEKDVEINGQPAAVVAVTGNGLREVKLFFDRNSGRLVRTQRRTFANGEAGVVEVSEETTLSDFKNFGKALLPTAMSVTHDGKKFMTMTMTEFTTPDAIDDREFAAD